MIPNQTPSRSSSIPAAGYARPCAWGTHATQGQVAEGDLTLKKSLGENNFFISPTELTTRGDGSCTPYAKRTATSSSLSSPCGRYQAELHMMLQEAIRPRITTNNIVYARNAAYSTSHSTQHLPGGPLHGTRCKTPHAKSLGCAREPPRRARQEITTPADRLKVTPKLTPPARERALRDYPIAQNPCS